MTYQARFRMHARKAALKVADKHPENFHDIVRVCNEKGLRAKTCEAAMRLYCLADYINANF